MFLADVLRSLRRRWYFVLVALLLAAGGTFLAAGQVGKTYDSTASVVLVPPVDSQDPKLNRFLNLSDVTTSVDVVVRSMSSSTLVQKLQDRNPGATYSITSDPTINAPVMLVTASASTAAVSRSMLGDVLAQIPRSLGGIQSQVGIDGQRQISSLVVARDAKPVLNNSARKRVLLVVFVGILGLLLLATAAFDSLANRRSTRRRTAAGAPTSRPRRERAHRASPGGPVLHDEGVGR